MEERIMIPLSQEEINYLNVIFGEIYIENKGKEEKLRKELWATLTQVQKNLLNRLLQAYNTRNRKICQRSFVQGFKKGLHIGLEYNRKK